MLFERAVIFANGDIPSDRAAQNLLRPGDFLVAADGGARHMLRLGIRPHLLVGDLDSLGSSEVETLAQAGVEVRRYPAEKDETDLELALMEADARGCRQIIIAAGLGGRLDQALGNIYLMLRPVQAEMRLDDGCVEAFWIRKRSELSGRPGDTVSLLPLLGPASGIWTQGLRYPLRGETLHPERTRGISNELVAENAAVDVGEGLLLCLHERKNLLA